MVAVGNPAEFRQRPDNQEQDLRGQAGHIEYFAGAEHIILEKDAHLWQGKNEFAGDRIEYDTANQTVKALTSGDEAGRVQVIIQPRAPSPVTPAP